MSLTLGKMEYFMIETQEIWMVEDALPIHVEQVVDAIYEMLKGKNVAYMIVHVGDLLVQLGSDPEIPTDDEMWVKAIYTAQRQGRIALLSGDPTHFAGNLHPIDHGEDPEEQSMLNSVIREPNGTVQLFVILRDW